MKFLKSGQKGFTLIELLVVIAILGTLAAVVVLNVTRFMGSGRDQAAATERHNVQTAVVAYMYEHPSLSADGTYDAGTAGGILAPSLLTPLNCTYVVTSGAVAAPVMTTCLK